MPSSSKVERLKARIAAAYFTRSSSSESASQGLTLVRKHEWSPSSVLLKTSFNLYARERNVGVDIDLSPFCLEATSLLRQVLRNIPCPAFYTYANSLRRVLVDLTAYPEAMAVLEAPTGTLASGDVNVLFARIEDVVEGFGGKTHYMRSSQARAYFAQLPVQLKDGRLVAQSGFKSRFSEGRREPRASVAGTLRSSDGTGTPVKVLDDFDSLDERNRRFLQQGLSRQSQIYALCDQTFGNHRAVVALIEEARAAGLPPMRPKVNAVIKRDGWLSSEVFSGHSEAEQLRIALHVFRREHFHRRAPVRYMPLTGMTFLHRYTLDGTQQQVFELLLSDTYLPRLVIVSCVVAIVTDTAFNAETVLSMTKRHVRRTRTGFFIVGLKGRTGQLQGAEVQDIVPDDPNSDDDPNDVRVSSSTAIQAIELLLKHAEAVEEHTGLQNVPLSWSMRLHYSGPHQFGPFNLYLAQQHFWKYHNAETVDWPELRRLAAHVNFLSPGGNIFGVQALLGHASVETTAVYLNTNLIHELLEANTRRYMRQLAATAIFLRGGDGELETRKLRKMDVQPKLLFPIGPFDTTDSAVDKWVASGGTLELSIGQVEVQHCALQYSYYQNNYRRLISTNAQRFTRIDFPRMLFCMALRKVILASPHASLYKRLERELP